MNVVTPQPTALLIDDEEGRRAEIRGLLLDAGYRPQVVGGCAEAFELLETGLVPDLILVDLFMPDTDAVGFRRRQIARPAWAAIPTVVLTMSTFHEQPVMAIGVPLLRKPFTLGELEAAVVCARQLQQAHFRPVTR